MDEEGDGNSSEEEVVDEYQPDSEADEPGKNLYEKRRTFIFYEIDPWGWFNKSWVGA